LGQAEFNVVFRHDGLSAILVYLKNHKNASPITKGCQIFSKLGTDDLQAMLVKTF
jgi:hypothetical protein